MIILSQMGRPRERVKISWLERLKEQGIRPIRLVKTIKINRLVTTDDSPFKDFLFVRLSWDIIVDMLIDLGIFIRDTDKLENLFKTKIRRNVSNRNIEVEGTTDVYREGSNEEKMSGIMQNSGGPIGDFEGLQFV